MTTNMSSVGEKRRRRRLFWLWIAGGTGALTLIAPALFVVVWNGLSYPGGPSLPTSTPPAWYNSLGISILLAIGPMLSALICWHFIVNSAQRVTWKRGLLAGLIASILAYPLTAIVAAWIVGLLSGGIQVPFLLGFSALAAIISLSLLLSLYGLATSILGVILGALLGWLQGRDEARLMDAAT